MNIFDVAMAFLFFLFLLRGVWVGLIGQLAFLAALVLGFMAAGAFYGDFAVLITPWVKQPQFGFLLTYTLLFFAVYLFIMLLGRGLRQVMSISMLAWFDRLTGGIFGAVKAVFIASLLFMGLAGFISGSRPLLRDSYSYPFLAVSSGYILLFIRDYDLRERFLSRDPAIPELMTSTIPPFESRQGAAEQVADDDQLVE
jgi:membrane protein required for colicin V production